MKETNKIPFAKDDGEGNLIDVLDDCKVGTIDYDAAKVTLYFD